MQFVFVNKKMLSRADFIKNKKKKDLFFFLELIYRWLFKTLSFPGYVHAHMLPLQR